MSAIIHNSFRKYNADNFIASIGTNKVYLMIGKNDAWSGASVSETRGSDPTLYGEYTETNPSDSAKFWAVKK